MRLKIGEKEFTIKYGYKPTLKERVISKVVNMSGVDGDNGEVNLEKVEDLLLYLPEMLLVGLQVHHEDFRYDYDTKEGKSEQLDKAFGLVEEYLEEEGADAINLYTKLQESMMEDGFLASLFRKEQGKAKKKEKAEVETEKEEKEV